MYIIATLYRSLDLPLSLFLSQAPSLYFCLSLVIHLILALLQCSVSVYACAEDKRDDFIFLSYAHTHTHICKRIYAHKHLCVFQHSSQTYFYRSLYLSKVLATVILDSWECHIFMIVKKISYFYHLPIPYTNLPMVSFHFENKIQRENCMKNKQKSTRTHTSSQRRSEKAKQIDE